MSEAFGGAKPREAFVERRGLTRRPGKSCSVPTSPAWKISSDNARLPACWRRGPRVVRPEQVMLALPACCLAAVPPGLPPPPHRGWLRLSELLRSDPSHTDRLQSCRSRAKCLSCVRHPSSPPELGHGRPLRPTSCPMRLPLEVPAPQQHQCAQANRRGAPRRVPPGLRREIPHHLGSHAPESPGSTRGLRALRRLTFRVSADQVL